MYTNKTRELTCSTAIRKSASAADAVAAAMTEDDWAEEVLLGSLGITCTYSARPRTVNGKQVVVKHYSAKPSKYFNRIVDAATRLVEALRDIRAKGGLYGAARRMVVTAGQRADLQTGRCFTQLLQLVGVSKPLCKVVVRVLYELNVIYIAGLGTRANTGKLYDLHPEWAGWRTSRQLTKAPDVVIQIPIQAPSADAEGGELETTTTTTTTTRTVMIPKEQRDLLKTLVAIKILEPCTITQVCKARRCYSTSMYRQIRSLVQSGLVTIVGSTKDLDSNLVGFKWAGAPAAILECEASITLEDLLTVARSTAIEVLSSGPGILGQRISNISSRDKARATRLEPAAYLVEPGAGAGATEASRNQQAWGIYYPKPGDLGLTYDLRNTAVAYLTGLIPDPVDIAKPDRSSSLYKPRPKTYSWSEPTWSLVAVPKVHHPHHQHQQQPQPQDVEVAPRPRPRIGSESSLCAT